MSRFKNFNQIKISELKFAKEISQLTPAQKFNNLISVIKINAVDDALAYIEYMSTEDHNQTDHEGRNCLHWAVLKNNQKVVKALCTNQTDGTLIRISDYAINLTDNYGHSALNYASMYGFVDLVCIIFSDSFYTKKELERKMIEDGNYTEKRLTKYCTDNNLSILTKKSETFKVNNSVKLSDCILIINDHNSEMNHLQTDPTGEIEQSHLGEIIT